ncbi:hypothetical protein [Flavobacterium sp. 3HN19-14]|uniref:hypothetical protein n=1 Tax=Flavobacterium sp. 3HN19-14 TaxID=3448133 RepID=UPI003EE30639
MKPFYKTVLFIALLLSVSSYAQEGAPSCAELQAHFELYQSCATNIPFQNSTGNTSGETLNMQTSCIPTNFHWSILVFHADQEFRRYQIGDFAGQ